VATALVATGPFIAITLLVSPPQLRAADDTEPLAVATQLSPAPRSGVPPAAPPLRRLSGLNQPDLRIPDLKKFVAPPSLAFLGAHPIALTAPIGAGG
jgi:hypothetical protein